MFGGFQRCLEMFDLEDDMFPCFFGHISDDVSYSTQVNNAHVQFNMSFLKSRDSSIDSFSKNRTMYNINDFNSKHKQKQQHTFLGEKKTDMFPHVCLGRIYCSLQQAWATMKTRHQRPCNGPTPQVVQVLLAWRGDVNGRDYDGETPLHLAVKLGDVELAGLSLGMVHFLRCFFPSGIYL